MKKIFLSYLTKKLSGRPIFRAKSPLNTFFLASMYFFTWPSFRASPRPVAGTKKKTNYFVRMAFFLGNALTGAGTVFLSVQLSLPYSCTSFKNDHLFKRSLPRWAEITGNLWSSKNFQTGTPKLDDKC